MTRDLGNEILHLWRAGTGAFSEATINAALRATGDLCPAGQKRSRPVSQRLGVPHRVWQSALAGGNSEAQA